MKLSSILSSFLNSNRFFLFFVLVFSNSMAQDKKEIITNQTVIALVKAGLDKSIIITTINNADSKFDVSSTTLINLTKQGVPNEVISVMVEKTTHKTNTSVIPNSATNPSKNKGSNYKIDLVNYPHLLNPKAQSVTPLERKMAYMVTRTKALGYGGTSLQYEIEGEKSTIRYSTSDSLSFIINTSGTIPEFTLFKAKIQKGKRTAASLTTKAFTGVRPSNNIISLDIFPIGNGYFKIVPAQKLEPSEYFLAGKPSLNATSIDVYAFGIE